MFRGPSASVPGGATLGGLCDRFWARYGYRLHFIDTDTILINAVIHTTLYKLFYYCSLQMPPSKQKKAHKAHF